MPIKPAYQRWKPYDPETDTWTTKASMPTPRKGLSTAVVDGLIYAIGGASVSEQRLATVEVYDPKTDTWASRADMPTARAILSTSVVDQKIYAIGGPWPGSQGIPIVEEYNPATDTWARKADMPTRRWGLSTTTVGSRVYAIGGHQGSAVAVVEQYDPTTDSWSTLANLPAARWGLSSELVGGVIYALGGSDAVGPPHPGLASTFAYVPNLFPVGDIDQDGSLTVADLDLLTEAIGDGTAGTTYDVNADGRVDRLDLDYWVGDLKRSWIGDADVDGEFNSGDLITVLAAGTYETGGPATWSTGDFDGSGSFDSGDLIHALAGGGYEMGRRAATQQAPEPQSGWMCAFGIVCMIYGRRSSLRPS